MHFPDLEVCCDWSTFFPLVSSDVCGAGTRGGPVRTSAWEASLASAVASSLLLPCGGESEPLRLSFSCQPEKLSGIV